MFVFNFKINRKLFIKIFTVIMIILISILLFFSVKKVVFLTSNKNVLNVEYGKKENSIVKNEIHSKSGNTSYNLKFNQNNSTNSTINDIESKENNKKITTGSSNNQIEVTTKNFTTFLKDCNENSDNYIGKNVHISGFVYRLSDFSKNQFVIGRLMPIRYENTSTINFEDENCVIVGILCEGSNLSNFKENSWVDINGIIEYRNYRGKIPVIQVSSIKQIEDNPQELFVEQPTLVKY